ncbi:hypothetical protein EDB89DRAFT_1905980 [Lactarius sanguifluus]|nr:hypothetical protein EDB89DRAFT_1905980 [Lactarius sanguifluus]
MLTALLPLLPLYCAQGDPYVCAVGHAGTALQESQIVSARQSFTVLCLPYTALRLGGRAHGIRAAVCLSDSGHRPVENSRRRIDNLEPNPFATNTWCYIGSNPGRPLEA